MIEQDLWSTVFVHYVKTSVANREHVVPDAKTMADAALVAYREAFPQPEPAPAKTSAPTAPKGKTEK